MYESFYGLRERPFNLTPDPKYLYLSDKHKEAFAHLLYGIKNRNGFVMISGEIGTGKTTICRNLLNQLDASTEVAFIFNPFLSPIELIKKINKEFGISSQADNILGLTEELNVHLLNSAAHGKNCVLVIDEAQNLTPQVLEQIRLLSNLETDSDKLLQIILIGQPELAEKLALHELRQLNQRITARYHLKPLNAEETLQYIAFRIHTAGGRKHVNFTKGAVNLVYRRSGGVPRMINALCDRALLIGYTRNEHTISASIIRHAEREIRGERIKLPKQQSFAWRRWIPNPSVAVLAVLVLVLAQYLVSPLDRFARELNAFNRILTGDAAGPFQTSDGAANVAATAGRTDPPAPLPAAPESSDNLGMLRQVMDRIQTGRPVRHTHSLLAVLEESDPLMLLRSGADSLLALWNRSPRAEVAGEDEASIVAYFATHGMAVESLSLSEEQIQAINLPSLVGLRVGENRYWMALVRLEEESAVLVAGPNRRITVPRSEFRSLYARELLAPWLDPSPDARVILPGQRGPNVRALKRQLQRLGRLHAENTSDVYDQDTESAVIAIQTETGLDADGKAGRQVRLALTSWLENTPELTRPGTTAASPAPGAARATEATPVAGLPPMSETTPQPDAGPEKATRRREDKPPSVPTIPAEEAPPVSISLPAPQAMLIPPPAISMDGGQRMEDPNPSDLRAPWRTPATQQWEAAAFEKAERAPAADALFLEVRELSEPFVIEPLPQRVGSAAAPVTAPVYGSLPLIPREAPSE